MDRLRVMAKILAVLLVLLAAWSMPCAALPEGAASFLDHAGLTVATDRYRGAFSAVGSFHSGAAREAYFEPLRAAPEPQPQGAALLFAGLGLLVLVARRRWLALRVAD
jgi:hypothetical protein